MPVPSMRRCHRAVVVLVVLGVVWRASVHARFRSCSVRVRMFTYDVQAGLGFGECATVYRW
jgi:hypothetical protein